MVTTERGIAIQVGKAWRAIRRHYTLDDLYQLKWVRFHRHGAKQSIIFDFQWDESIETSWCHFYVHSTKENDCHYLGTFCVGADKLYTGAVSTFSHDDDPMDLELLRSMESDIEEEMYIYLYLLDECDSDLKSCADEYGTIIALHRD